MNRSFRPEVNRCCKIPPPDYEFSDYYNLERIDCNISKEDFFHEYIRKRNPVFLRGCEETWRAKNWTIEGKV